MSDKFHAVKHYKKIVNGKDIFVRAHLRKNPRTKVVDEDGYVSYR